MNQPSTVLFSQFKHPRYWPTWLLVGFLWLLAHLPASLQRATGKALGKLMYRLAARRRRIALTNIQLCYPELSPEQQLSLVKKTFSAHGIGIIETAIAWFRDKEDYRKHIDVEGLERVQAAQAQGKPVILLGTHFTTLDLSGFLVSLLLEINVTYRPHNNPLIDAVMTKSRNRLYEDCFTRKDLRGFLRCLKKNRILWIAIDQDLGKTNSVFAPFFNVQAATITSASRLAKLSNATVIPFYCFRHPETQRYQLRFCPVLDTIPSGDDVADATTINQWVENSISSAPEQYMWLHRRFKTRPDGEEKIY